MADQTYTTEATADLQRETARLQHPDDVPANPWGEGPPQLCGTRVDPQYVNLLMWGGAALVVLGVLIVALFFVTGGFGPSSPRTFSLASGRADETWVTFEKGIKVQIWVHSEFDSDVDLFVFDHNRKLIVRDEDDSKNCYVCFTPRETESFKIVVANRIRLEPYLQERNRENHCTLKWEQGKKAKS